MPPKKRNLDTNKTVLNIDMANQNPIMKPFPHPFFEGEYGEGSKPKSSLELNLMSLSASIRSKLNWHEKRNNESIRNKWKQEALEQSSLTSKQIDYVLAELEYYDAIRENSIEMSSVDGVWQSDYLITNELKQSLIECVRVLEDVPELDWHPGTNNQILDLVHPSLFCLVYGETKILNKKERIVSLENTLTNLDNDGEIIYADLGDEKYPDYTMSSSYQWLPSEFKVSNEGQVKIESYINNLIPTQHEKLYKVIEEIFFNFIPLFNKALTDLDNKGIKPCSVKVDPFKWYKSDDEVDDNSEEDDYSDGFEKRELILPDVDTFKMPSLENFSKIDLKGKNLQVIVKLANIVLTPEHPSYGGGVWHVEGMKNEHIVASGIYYYHSSNISQSNLQFRTVIAEPDYEQNDERGVRTVYGLNDEMPLNQRIGDVVTQENRCIVFPNIYQHCVAPFHLEDSTKPGVRKILVFFLVDPSLRIISTANVPPQQSHWYTAQSESKYSLRNHVKMTMKEAKEHRESLMKERKFFIAQNNEYLYERPFSLCEH
jgi:hypothetical protein